MPKRVLPALLVALVIAGCGGDDDEGGNGGSSGGSEDTTAFSEAGFAITFEVPDEFKEAESITVGQNIGSSARGTAGLALNGENLILVQRYALRQAVTERNLDAAKREFDRLVTRLAGRPVTGQASDVAGLPSLRYDDVPLNKPAQGESRLVVLFDGSTEYLINCQSTPDRREELERGCDQALETLKKK